MSFLVNTGHCSKADLWNGTDLGFFLQILSFDIFQKRHDLWNNKLVISLVKIKHRFHFPLISKNNLFETLFPNVQVSSRHQQMLDLLTSFLDEVGPSGESASEFLALYQRLTKAPHWKLYLAAKGVLPHIGALLTKVKENWKAMIIIIIRCKVGPKQWERESKLLALYQHLTKAPHWNFYLVAKGVLPHIRTLLTKVKKEIQNSAKQKEVNNNIYTIMTWKIEVIS